jgi:acetylornithine/N-succinyldiaminopimelate aminotransferase
MIGAELIAEHAGKAGDISELARQHGVLVLIAGPNVLRFLPPLTISDADIAEGMKRLKATLAAYKASSKAA